MALRKDILAQGHFRQVAFALGGAVLLMAAKATVVTLGWQPIAATNLLPALMGGVVFTLAIVLSGVLADFREAERSIGELASQVRRLYWDVCFIGASAATVAKLRGQFTRFVATLLEAARPTGRWDGPAVRATLEAVDRTMVEEVKQPLGMIRTVQVGLGSVLKMVDRLHVIVGTTFLQAGHAFAGSAIALVLGGFLASDLGPAAQAVPLVGITSFILIGLYLLVRDLDNPLDGNVRVDLEPLEELHRFLEDEAAAAQAPAPPVARLVATP